MYYEYNCHVQGRGNFLRYDNSHGRARDDDEGNARMTWHHRHEWDAPTDASGNGDGRRIYIDDEGWPFPNDWPMLDEVVREAHQWYLSNHESLSLRDEYADLSRAALRGHYQST